MWYYILFCMKVVILYIALKLFYIAWKLLLHFRLHENLRYIYVAILCCMSYILCSMKYMLYLCYRIVIFYAIRNILYCVKAMLYFMLSESLLCCDRLGDFLYAHTRILFWDRPDFLYAHSCTHCILWQFRFLVCS